MARPPTRVRKDADQRRERALRLATAQTARRDGRGVGKQPGLVRKAPKCRRHPRFEREILLAILGMVAKRCAYTRPPSGPQFRTPSTAQPQRRGEFVSQHASPWA